jgi:beta-phosphoglucomutase-like phosphatase (HAD superfamily)
MIKGAIFDADGTLLDSMGMWETVGQRYLATQGVEARPGLRQVIFPMSLAQCAEYLKEAYHLDPAPKDIEAGINGVIRQFYCQEVTAKAGAKEFLQALRAKGVKCTLATATEHSVIQEGLARTGLLPLLDGLFTCGDLNTHKGEPTIFHHARDFMGTRTEDTWVFEDAVHAASTACKAGYPVAGVADPYSDQEALRAVCRLYLPTLTDFPAFYQQAAR